MFLDLHSFVLTHLFSFQNTCFHFSWLDLDPYLLAVGYYFCVSAIPLVFACIFAGDKKHVTVWKALLKGTRISALVTSTQSSSA